LRETQTRTLVDELAAGDLDLILLSLPLHHPDIETSALFEDRFVYVTNTGDAIAKKSRRVELSSVDESRLLLLEEGHCLRDQALQFCRTAHRATAGKPDLGAASLSTIMQLISNGFGATLLPEMALRAEIGTNPEVRALRFSNPEPSRQIGLAWRRKSPRKKDFSALGNALKDAHAASRPGTHSRGNR
jgi:LysR family hydrogen peroxide-inducible transcriptional activator